MRASPREQHTLTAWCHWLHVSSFSEVHNADVTQKGERREFKAPSGTVWGPTKKKLQVFLFPSSGWKASASRVVKKLITFRPWIFLSSVVSCFNIKRNAFPYVHSLAVRALTEQFLCSPLPRLSPDVELYFWWFLIYFFSSLRVGWRWAKKYSSFMLQFLVANDAEKHQMWWNGTKATDIDIGIPSLFSLQGARGISLTRKIGLRAKRNESHSKASAEEEKAKRKVFGWIFEIPQSKMRMKKLKY